MPEGEAHQHEARESGASSASSTMTGSAAFSWTWKPNMKPQSAAYAHARGTCCDSGRRHRATKHGAIAATVISAAAPAPTCTCSAVSAAAAPDPPLGVHVRTAPCCAAVARWYGDQAKKLLSQRASCFFARQAWQKDDLGSVCLCGPFSMLSGRRQPFIRLRLRLSHAGRPSY